MSTWPLTTSTRPARTSVATGRPNDGGSGPSTQVRSSSGQRPGPAGTDRIPRQQALQAERDALAAAIPKALTSELRQAESDLRAATRNLDSLHEERGLRSDGELGRAAGELLSARQHAFQHQRTAANKDRPRGIRRIARRTARPTTNGSR